MLGVLVLILGGYLLWKGSLPIGRFPYFFNSTVTGGSAGLILRTAGGLILAAGLLPDAIFDPWYGDVILLIAAFILIFIGLVASLSGRAP